MTEVFDKKIIYSTQSYYILIKGKHIDDIPSCLV